MVRTGHAVCLALASTLLSPHCPPAQERVGTPPRSRPPHPGLGTWQALAPPPSLGIPSLAPEMGPREALGSYSGSEQRTVVAMKGRQ